MDHIDTPIAGPTIAYDDDVLYRERQLLLQIDELARSPPRDMSSIGKAHLRGIAASLRRRASSGETVGNFTTPPADVCERLQKSKKLQMDIQCVLTHVSKNSALI